MPDMTVQRKKNVFSFYKSKVGARIQFKFLSIMIGTLVAIAVILSLFTAQTQQKLLMQSLMSKGQGLGSYMSKLSRDALVARDFVKLDELVNEANKDPEVAYAVVSGQDKKPVTTIFSSTNYKIAWVKKATSSLPKDTELNVILTELKKSHYVREITVPVVMDQVELGSISIGMSDHIIQEQLVATVTFVFILNVVCTAAVGIVLYFLTQKIILKPLVRLKASMAQVASGDLTCRIETHSNDEIGDLTRSLNKMVDDLKALVSKIKESAYNTATSAQQIASGSAQLSQGTTEQAASAEEASSSVEEMSATIRQNAENALQTEKIALAATEEAQMSANTVSGAISAMKEITQKISIIEEIARQTNLLALNAAIEAARAGQHGKGFAVVAAEVRKLAERSQKAAAEINQLSVSSFEVAERAGQMIMQLVPAISKTAALVQEISAASREQTSGAEQISSAIQQLNQVVQTHAGAAEEMASTADDLSVQAEHLVETITFFKVEQGEQSGAASQPHVPRYREKGLAVLNSTPSLS